MKLLTKLKKDERFCFTTLSGRKAQMLAYVRFYDVQGLQELENELLSFYGYKSNDYSLAFVQQSENFITDFAIAKDCKTNKVFSYKE